MVPKVDWYDGWQQSDWHFINDSVDNAIRLGHFNKDLKYMSGVTTQEAAYILCEFIIYTLHLNNAFLSIVNLLLLTDNNKTSTVNEEFFNNKVKELVLQYNYTLNPSGVFQAIKYLYTYWPDPHNTDSIRTQYINVKQNNLVLSEIFNGINLHLYF